METKKRVALLKKGEITTRLDYTYLTDEAFDRSVQDIANRWGVHPEHVLTYTLGNEDETNEGNCYFCPRCGHYNEWGHEPHTRQYYRHNPETGRSEPAGYFKSLTLECDQCEETFEIQTDTWDEEGKRMTKAFQEEKETSR